MNSIFITATDTSVGKTLISSLLLDFLLRSGVRADYQKWVSTGDLGIPADLKSCLDFAGLDVDPRNLDEQVPFRFQLAASPHLAAEQEGATIDVEELTAKWRRMASSCQFLIVEGVGGLLVPLRRDLLLADLLARLQIPTLVVARSGLGTLNHTLLTMEAMRQRAIPALGVVFCDSHAHEDERLVADNMSTIETLGATRVFGRVPWIANDLDGGRGRKIFAPIGQAILAAVDFPKAAG